MKTAGNVKVKENVKHTGYFWGPMSDIEGKTLPLIEQNKQGDCLCTVGNNGLVDVDPRDIEKVTLNKSSDIFKEIF